MNLEDKPDKLEIEEFEQEDLKHTHSQLVEKKTWSSYERAIRKIDFDKHVTCFYDKLTEKNTYSTNITKGKLVIEKQEVTKSLSEFDGKRKQTSAFEKIPWRQKSIHLRRFILYGIETSLFFTSKRYQLACQNKSINNNCIRCKEHRKIQ